MGSRVKGTLSIYAYVCVEGEVHGRRAMIARAARAHASEWDGECVPVFPEPVPGIEGA